MKVAKGLGTTPLCTALAILAMPCTGFAQGTLAPWVGSDGNYSNTANWQNPTVPCNKPWATYAVEIPRVIDPPFSPVTVTVDPATEVPCEVDSLTLGTDSKLALGPGADYRVLIGSDINGIISGEGGDFTSATVGDPDLLSTSEFTGSTLLGNRARFWAAAGSDVRLNGTSYSPIGLTRNDGDPWDTEAYSWNILKSSDPETLLDLSSLESIDAGFVQNSNDVNRHEITAENEAQINLANLQSVHAPVSFWDWLRFNISDTAEIDLSSLTTVTSAGSGQTVFNLTQDASLSLPELQSTDRLDFSRPGGERGDRGSPGVRRRALRARRLPIQPRRRFGVGRRRNAHDSRHDWPDAERRRPMGHRGVFMEHPEVFGS